MIEMNILNIVIIVFSSLMLLSLIGVILLKREKIRQEKESMENLKRVMASELGKFKIDLAKRQARRNGVGVVIHEGKVYTLMDERSPLKGTLEFKQAYEKSMEEKKGILHAEPRRNNAPKKPR